MKKEIPILFSTDMVQALLEGRKTQTRRIAAVPIYDHFGKNIMDWELSHHPYQQDGKWQYHIQTDVDDYAIRELKNRYGQPGDILWVRETWLYRDKHDQYYYKADHTDFEPFAHNGWKPSIHMPKAACRLRLKITDISVERLHDITEEDAIAEGVEQNRDGSWHDYLEPNRLWQDCAKASYISLWEKINGPESWIQNPFVWVISFTPYKG